MTRRQESAARQWRQAPAVQIKEAAKKASSSSSSAQAPTGDMIFGRPFGGEVVKMKDLNLDMYRVVVAGKVFAVNHKELKSATPGS